MDANNNWQCGRVSLAAALLLAATLVTPGRASADPASAAPVAKAARPQTPPLEVLEASGAVVGDITIKNGSIFDLENPEEDKLLYRFANKTHITTRPQVIEQQLLFAPGEPLSAQRIQESERILRGNRYLQNARITALPQDDGVVDIEVATRDTWTLLPKLSFSHSGGESATRLGIKEGNLLGTGISLEALFKSDVDRDTKVLKVSDDHLADSWYGASVVYEDSSDGFTRNVQIGKPFYALDATRANGINFYDNDRVDSLYDHGEIGSQYRQESQTREIQFGWSEGLQDGWVKRFTAGFGIDEHRFSAVADGMHPALVMPEDRKFAYPFFAFELVQDSFEKVRNHDQIARVEDRFTGTAFNFKLGLARAGLGSDRDALLFDAGAYTSFYRSKTSSLVLSSEFSGRQEAGGIANALLNVNAKYYKRHSEKRLLVAQLGATFGHELDLDQVPYLGGDNGLRGYPLRYQSGDKMVLFTLEQRFFTDWYPLQLFPVGAAVFFDAGKVWGEHPLGVANDGVLRDIGVGLRIGNPRSGRGGVVHVDVAYPLDGPADLDNVQFLVELKQGF